MTGMAMLAITCSGGSTTPKGRRASTRSSGTKTSSIVDVVAPGTAHPQRVPVVVHRDPVGAHRHGHVEDHRLGAVVEHEHGREHVAHRDLAGEDLAAGHPVPAFDRDSPTAGMGEVGAARRDEDDPLAGDAAQRGLGTRQAAPVPPGGEQGDVLVHRRGERGRPARSGQGPLRHGDLADRRPAPAELLRHGDRQVPGRAQQVERLGDERAVAVVARGVGCDLRRRARRPS